MSERIKTLKWYSNRLIKLNEAIIIIYIFINLIFAQKLPKIWWENWINQMQNKINGFEN
jgi:hypothetical protein